MERFAQIPKEEFLEVPYNTLRHCEEALGRRGNPPDDRASGICRRLSNQSADWFAMTFLFLEVFL